MLSNAAAPADRCLPCERPEPEPHCTNGTHHRSAPATARSGLRFQDSLTRRKNRRRHAAPLALEGFSGPERMKSILQLKSVGCTSELNNSTVDLVCKCGSVYVEVVPQCECYERKPYRKLLSMPLRAAPKIVVNKHQHADGITVSSQALSLHSHTSPNGLSLWVCAPGRATCQQKPVLCPLAGMS